MELIARKITRNLAHIVANGMIVDTFAFTNGEWVSALDVRFSRFSTLENAQAYVLDNILCS